MSQQDVICLLKESLVFHSVVGRGGIIVHGVLGQMFSSSFGLENEGGKTAASYKK